MWCVMEGGEGRGEERRVGRERTSPIVAPPVARQGEPMKPVKKRRTSRVA